MAPVPTLQPGQILGRYRVLRHIGSGGMGAVYEAEHVSLGKRCALKVLKPEFAKDSAVAARLQREGVTASQLRHRNVVDVYDIDSADDVLFLVMEYLEGEDFSSFLEREGPLAPPTALDLLLPVLDAVQAAHRAGIIHRDLKPNNIFLERDDHGAIQPKVLDFGIARPFEKSDEPQLTATGSLLGTPRYMSPEQVSGKKELGPATDQYSLGVILYESVVGASPFPDLGVYGLIFHIAEGQRIPPLKAKPDLDEALAAVILRAMAVATEDRFENLRTMTKALLPFASPAAQAWWTTALDKPATLDLAASLPPRPAAAGEEVAALAKAAELGAQAPAETAAPLADGAPILGRQEPPLETPPSPFDSLGFAATSLRVTTSEQSVAPTPEVVGPTRPEPKNRTLLAAAGVTVSGLLLASASVGAYLLHRPPPKDEGTPPATPGETMPLVRPFRIQVEPATAAIFFDDQEPVTGELRGSFRPGEATHRIVVTLDGYVSQIITFRYDPPAERIVLKRAEGR